MRFSRYEGTLFSWFCTKFCFAEKQNVAMLTKSCLSAILNKGIEAEVRFW